MTSIPSYDSFTKTPLWFSRSSWVDQVDYEPPRGMMRYDVTIEKLVPEHDGYCTDSGIDSSEECNYVREVLCLAFSLDYWELEDFSPREFRYKNGCTCRGGDKSGYCNWYTRVRIISIERWPN